VRDRTLDIAPLGGVYTASLLRAPDRASLPGITACMGCVKKQTTDLKKKCVLSSSRLFEGCFSNFSYARRCCNFKKIAQAGCVLILSWFLLRLEAILCNKIFNTVITLQQDNKIRSLHHLFSIMNIDNSCPRARHWFINVAVGSSQIWSATELQHPSHHRYILRVSCHPEHHNNTAGVALKDRLHSQVGSPRSVGYAKLFSGEPAERPRERIHARL
jgi:hypothetical protein